LSRLIKYSYGLGGVALPFVGIKTIGVLLAVFMKKKGEG
jgi:high-affinity K+ transport system ATPase subunit B